MNIIDTLEKEEMARLGKTIPEFAPGDTVIVNVSVVEGERKRVQAYEGVVIAKRNRGLNSSFVVRKISSGEGVERTFQTYSPLLASIEVKRKGDVRRAKLYYLRDRSGKSARIRKYYAKTRDGQGNVEEALRFINHASRILSDHDRRVRYDEELAVSDGTTEQRIAHVVSNAMAEAGEQTDVKPPEAEPEQDELL